MNDAELVTVADVAEAAQFDLDNDSPGWSERVTLAGLRAVASAAWNEALDAATTLAFKRKGGYETGIDLIELRNRESLNSEKEEK